MDFFQCFYSMSQKTLSVGRGFARLFRPMYAGANMGHPSSLVSRRVQASYAAFSIAFHSSADNRTLAAPTFSSRCFTEDVPGIGNMTGE
jgi:hypothetical protein